MPSAEKILNPQQLEAITHGDGPLLIIAGAGTGKTTVITERIKWLVTEHSVKPADILALTFTEKAALEMQERVDRALPYGYTEVWTMTFHSFCDRMLKDDGVHMGLNPGYRLMTDTTATALLRRHIFELELEYFRPSGNPNKFIGGLLTHFSRLKDEDVNSADYTTWATKQLAAAKTEPEKLEAQKFVELARIFEFYQKLKVEKSLLDFGDLICTALELLRKRPNILETYRKKFKYILVDEFQDTNYAQNQLVGLLVGNKPNLTVVADDDQAIYRWRGAAVSNVLQFRSSYPDAKLVVLTQNYRSSQEILDRSYDLITHNNPDRLEVREGISKKLISIQDKRGVKVQFLHTSRAEEEAEAVVDQISSLKDKNSELAYKDFAILVRANAHADSFVRSLERRGLPYQFLGPAQLFHQPEIKDLIAYLRVLKNIDDDAALLRVLSMDFWGLPGRDLATLGSFARKYNLHLFEVCEVLAGKSLRTLPEKPLLAPKASETLCKIVDLVRAHLEQAKKETAGQVLFAFLQEGGLLTAIVNYSDPLDENRALNITRFFNKLKTFEIDNTDASVDAVVDWLDLSMELGESPLASDSDWTTNDAVNILTIHSSKGLEFPVVFLVNLVSQRFPSIERSEQIPIPDALVKEVLPVGDHHLQEERRLCYVGMTRARERLFLTGADFYGEGKREKKISPFVGEALGDQPDIPTKSSSEQLTLLEWQKYPKAAVGQQIQNDRVTYLSYSQIQTFLDCPRHYHAKYNLRIPETPTASLSFGISMHKTMQDFYTDPSRDIFQIYKNSWVKVGYMSGAQEQDFYKKGERFLKQYLEKEYSPERRPTLLEQKFNSPLIRDKRLLKIGGKIDRVDVLPDGRIEIIDYKTGANSLTDKEAESNLQLSFYALAATLIREVPFNRKPADVKLTLYYFDEQKKVSTTRTAEQLADAADQIFNIADQIEHSDFKCSKSMLCKTCEFKMLCDLV